VQLFSYRSARSGSVTIAISVVVLIESVALHFLIAARHPLIAWPLTLLSLAAVLWIVRDYRALGVGSITIDEQILDLRIGRRFDIAVPLSAIERAITPTFRDLPTPGTNQGRDYLNLTKPAAPNVLILLDQPRRVRLTAGMHRSVKRLGFRVDDPAELLRALEKARG
jgi:hypothetical protein